MYSKNMYGMSSYSDTSTKGSSEEIIIKDETNLINHLPSFYHSSEFVRNFMEK